MNNKKLIDAEAIVEHNSTKLEEAVKIGQDMDLPVSTRIEKMINKLQEEV